MWSRKYSCCTKCKTIKVKHHANGLCDNCYQLSYLENNPEQRTTYAERRTDLRYRISICYALMKRRALAKNMDILSKKEFKAFAFCSEELKSLHEDWIASGFDIKKTPSIDRVNNERGYVLGNMQFITHSKNVIKGNREVRKEGHLPTRKRAVTLTKGARTYIFETSKEACDFLGCPRNAVCIALKKKTLLHGWEVSDVKIS